MTDVDDNNEDETQLQLAASLVDAARDGGTDQVRREMDQPEGSTDTVPSEAVDDQFGSYATLQEFFCPVHGPVRLWEAEVRVINHPAVQRLRDILQLGQTVLVYPGTSHSRLEHALGTLHVAELMLRHLNQNTVNPKLAKRHGIWDVARPIGPSEAALIRLAALLHDIGHIPAGHTFEDELGLLSPHDSEERLKLVLDSDTWRGEAERPLRSLIDELYDDVARNTGFTSATEAVLALISRDRPMENPKANTDVFRVGVCRSIVSDTVCADLLDYLHRDWLHLGKTRHFDMRILEYMELRERPTRNGRESVVVVNVRSRDQLRHDAITAILDLLESRYQLFEIALFHRTKLTATAMLERAVAEIADAKGKARDAWLNSLAQSLLESSDAEMLALLREQALDAARSSPAGTRDLKRERLDAAARVLRALRVRDLYKKLHVVTAAQLGDPFTRDVQNLYDGSDGSLDERRRKARNRLSSVRFLEEDFGLPPGSVVMYCPPRRMNSKLAEVQVLIDDEVMTLDQHEKRATAVGASLTAGMLSAQKTRFERLWRVQFAMRRDVRERVQEAELRGLLVDAIDLLVLGRRPGSENGEGALRIAQQLRDHPWPSPCRGNALMPVSSLNRAHFTRVYPTGVPSLKEFISPR